MAGLNVITRAARTRRGKDTYVINGIVQPELDDIPR